MSIAGRGRDNRSRRHQGPFDGSGNINSRGYSDLEGSYTASRRSGTRVLDEDHSIDADQFMAGARAWKEKFNTALAEARRAHPDWSLDQLKDRAWHKLGEGPRPKRSVRIFRRPTSGKRNYR